MEAIRVEQIMLPNGELRLHNLPYTEGQRVEVIVVPWPEFSLPRLTVGQFRRSGLIGLWKDRTDITDSSEYARQLREQAQRREFNDAVIG